MIGLPALRRGGRAVLHAALALAVGYAVRRALAAWAAGDPTPFTRHTRHLRGAMLRVYTDLYYSLLPVRSIALPDVPPPAGYPVAPRIRDAVETPCSIAAPDPVHPPHPPTRGQLRVRIREAIDAHTAGSPRVALAAGLCYAYHASADRDAGRDRLYAVAALRARDCLQGAMTAQPGPDVDALCRAVEALLRGCLAAATAHLDGIAHAAPGTEVRR